MKVFIPVYLSRNGKKVDVYVPESDRPDKAFASDKNRAREEKAVAEDHYGDGPPPTVVWVTADLPEPPKPARAAVVKGRVAK